MNFNNTNTTVADFNEVGLTSKNNNIYKRKQLLILIKDKYYIFMLLFIYLTLTVKLKSVSHKHDSLVQFQPGIDYKI